MKRIKQIIIVVLICTFLTSMFVVFGGNNSDISAASGKQKLSSICNMKVSKGTTKDWNDKIDTHGAISVSIYNCNSSFYSKDVLQLNIFKDKTLVKEFAQLIYNDAYSEGDSKYYRESLLVAVLVGSNWVLTATGLDRYKDLKLAQKTLGGEIPF